MADQKLPVVEFKLDEERADSGIFGVSLVKKPAMESNFQFFDKAEHKPVYLAVQEYEQVVHGITLIPNKPVLRLDASGKPYYGFFSADTIKKLRDRRFQQLTIQNYNTDHDQNQKFDGYVIESFIVDSEERKADLEAKGFKDVVLGSLYEMVKIPNKEVFQKVVSGEVMGFSIEANLDSYLTNIVLEEQVNNNNNLKTELLTMNNLIEKFAALLEEMKGSSKTEKFEEAKVYEGEDRVRFTEVGAPVTVISPDGSEKPAAEGNYILDDQRELSVDAAGNLAEIRSTSDQTPSEEPSEVSDSGATSPSMSAVPLAQFEAVSAELASVKEANVKFEAEIEKLKAEVTKLAKAPITTPAIKTEKKVEKLSAVELAKLSNVQRIAYLNGVEVFESKK